MSGDVSTTRYDIANTTQSTSTSTGALILLGGLGATANVHCVNTVTSGDIYCDGNPNTIAWKDSGGTARDCITRDASDQLILGNTNINDVKFIVTTGSQIFQTNTVTDLTDSWMHSTGTHVTGLNVSGGIGVAKALYVGGTVAYTEGSITTDIDNTVTYVTGTNHTGTPTISGAHSVVVGKIVYLTGHITVNVTAGNTSTVVEMSGQPDLPGSNFTAVGDVAGICQEQRSTALAGLGFMRAKTSSKNIEAVFKTISTGSTTITFQCMYIK